MPEGDTVHLAAATLRRALAGAIVTRSELRVPRFATVRFDGETLDEVLARGKHLLFRFSSGRTLHSHLKMEGSWHVYNPGERWRGPGHEVRAVVETETRVAVGFRLGIVDVLETAREHEAIGHLGPDVLGEDWDAAEAALRMRAHPDAAIADALIDQTIVAGFGNVYRNEICFLRGVSPWTPVRDVDVDAAIALGKRLIEANRHTPQRVTTGDTRPGRRLWVYGRAGRPCLRCGTPIMRRAAGPERVTYWCPRCQPSARGTTAR